MAEPIVIWGSGAIGGTIGAYLRRAGRDVLFVDVVPEHVHEIAAGRLRIDGPVDQFTTGGPAVTPDAMTGRHKLILLCVKAHHTEGAARTLAPFLAEDGAVVSCQNGLNELVIAQTVGRARTIGAFVNFGADYQEPGRILYAGRGAVVVGELDGATTPRIQALHETLRLFEPDAVLSDNIFGYLWGKAGYGGILKSSALTNDTIADYIADPRRRRLIIGLVREILSIAAAEGVTPLGFDGFDPLAFMRGDRGDRGAIDASLAALAAYNAGTGKPRSGIWRDLAVRRRQTDVTAQLAPVQAAAQRHGIVTPRVDRLVALIQAVEAGQREIGPELADELGDVVAEGSGPDGPLMMRHLTRLAQYVKLSGSPEEAESLAYIRQAMDGYGYTTRIEEHDAYISLPGPARVVVDGQVLTAITHSMSQSSPAGGTTGRLVDVGAGSVADFARQDITGCIVLVEGMATPAVTLAASRAGAAGQLHISPHAHLHEMCLSPVWGSPSEETKAQLPASVACTIAQSDGAALRQALARGEKPAVTLHASVETGWRRTPILVAEMITGDEPFVLFSGHHDTWHFGVMDNGSANVAMMEVARICAQSRPSWQRGLRLCFWSGHSHGRYSGSAWYADTHWDELERRCVAHVNIDSVGAVGASVLTNAGSAAELAGLAMEVIARQTGQTHAGKRMPRAGDQSFWGIGIPAIFMSLSEQLPGSVSLRHALGWWWHTPDDLLDKIDPANLVRDTRIYLDVLDRLLVDAVLPIDHVAQLDSLTTELVALDGPQMPLEGLREQVFALREELLAARVKLGPEQLNACILRLSRALVPLDYTNGDRFSHDPALPLLAWPVLEPLRRLASAVPGSDAARRMEVSARRARNRVAHALREAAAVLTSWT